MFFLKRELRTEPKLFVAKGQRAIKDRFRNQYLRLVRFSGLFGFYSGFKIGRWHPLMPQVGERERK